MFTLLLIIFTIIACTAGALIVFYPLIMVISFIIGVLKGMAIMIKAAVLNRKNKSADPEDLIFEDDLQQDDYYMLLPEDLETLKALEYSAEAAQEEINYYTNREEQTEDAAEKIKYKKRIAAAKKRLANDNKKIVKIRRSYFR